MRDDLSGLKRTLFAMSLRSVLLLTAIAVHFTGEPGMSCPWDGYCRVVLFFVLSILTLKSAVFRIL